MSTSETRTVTPRKSDELISIALATVISVLAVAFTVAPLLPVLIAWQVVAIGYLVLVFTVFRNRSTWGVSSSRRPLPRRALEYLSWVLPIAASGTGVASAVTLLTTNNADFAGDGRGALVGIMGSAGVIIAWLLLQAGFAEIYESVYDRLPDAGMISFPGVAENPTLSDFLYLSFTVGTSFAISGATIASRKVRRVILVHSITSFFYNAFLIAIAIEVLRGLIASGG